MIDLGFELTDKLTLWVKDEGIGIPAQDKEKMFTRFFRASNAFNIEGTGLGLNIVKRYVELLEGHIYFRTELGKGTTFYIEFPKQK